MTARRPARHRSPAHAEVVQLFERAFLALGIHGADPEATRTPERVARLYEELFWGLDPSAAPKLSLSSHEGRDLVILRDVPFYSMCVHHLLPFFGRAAMAYRPNGQVAGLSSLVDVVQYFAARPQLQERLAEQIAAYLAEHLRPEGLIVQLVARHMCVEMRGRSRPCHVECLAARGCLVSGADRAEALRRLGPSGRSLDGS